VACSAGLSCFMSGFQRVDFHWRRLEVAYRSGVVLQSHSTSETLEFLARLFRLCQTVAAQVVSPQ